MTGHDEVIKEKRLPSVGQVVKSKKHGTLWRVVEKKEVWKNAENTAGEPILLPAIYLRYSQVKDNKPTGKSRGYEYTLHDNTFKLHWEVVV